MSGRHRRGNRWEVVARIHADPTYPSPTAPPSEASSWIMPVSVGRRPHRTRLAAWRETRAMNRRETPDWGPYARGLHTTWETRRARA